MPRGSGGWGYQFVHGYRHESDLLLGRTKKHPGFTEDVHLLHLQGVYTWDKSIRLTAKLPYVLDARREMPDGLGGKRVERDNGIGDLTLALPLKKYFNLDGRSGSLSVGLRWNFASIDAACTASMTSSAVRRRKRRRRRCRGSGGNKKRRKY